MIFQKKPVKRKELRKLVVRIITHIFITGTQIDFERCNNSKISDIMTLILLQMIIKKHFQMNLLVICLELRMRQRGVEIFVK